LQGTQVAVNVHQWRQQDNSHWKKCLNNGVITEETADRMMHEAVCAMARLNKNGGKAMLKYGAHAGTDVTGFGILGHAQNLSENQVAPVGLEIHTLPCIAGTPQVNNQVMDFRLIKGYSAETSGGLMVCMSEESAQGFCKELEELDGCKTWIIGRVVESAERKSRILDDVQVLSV
jgi:selenide,water dikinase